MQRSRNFANSKTMMWSSAYYLEITLGLFLAVIVRCASCVMHCPSILENKYSNTFFDKTIAPTVLKFYIEHYLAPGSQNYTIVLGRISKMATITKNNKNDKINFLSRTTEYFWLNFGMEYQWNIGIQNCKNEKKSVA